MQRRRRETSPLAAGGSTERGRPRDVLEQSSQREVVQRYHAAEGGGRVQGSDSGQGKSTVRCTHRLTVQEAK